FIFHFLVAGVGAYYLCRSWKYPPYLSIVGALLFALGGTIVSLANLLNHFQTAVWLPWIILSWEKVLRNVSWKHFLAFTLILAIQFLAGSPELFALTMALVIIDGIRVKLSYPNVSYRGVIAIFFAANLLVLMLVMIQLLPTVELFSESRRQRPIPPQEVLHWSLKPMSLLNLVFLDKEIDLKNPVGLRLFFAREAPFFVSYYLGAICIFGVSLWVCFSSIREKIILLSLVTLSLTCGVGGTIFFTQIPCGCHRTICHCANGQAAVVSSTCRNSCSRIVKSGKASCVVFGVPATDGPGTRKGDPTISLRRSHDLGCFY